MALLILNPTLAEQVMQEREKSPDHRMDEVWDGVTVIMPEADVEHDDIAGFFYRAFWAAFGESTEHRIQYRINVSDRVVGWTNNYRIPDSSVFLADNPAKMCGTHYCGGPDLALEVVSSGDRSRDKLEFYAGVGTREVVVVDRDPWQIELYSRTRGKMRLKGRIVSGDGKVLASNVVPVTIQLLTEDDRPKVKVIIANTGQVRTW